VQQQYGYGGPMLVISERDGVLTAEWRRRCPPRRIVTLPPISGRVTHFYFKILGGME
jgi:hypothetical protein